MTDQQVSKTATDIYTTCDEIRDMLLDKNMRDGDSALTPIRVFSKADSVSQLLVRLDDKLSRIRNVQEDDLEDPILDLLGYLVLLRIAQKRQQLTKLGAVQ